jgi:putative transposase
VKRERFSVEQIVAVLKQAEVGLRVAELIRQVGISEQTLYRWKKHQEGLATDQVRQFKQLAGREWAAEVVSGGADVGQGDVARCAGKNCDALATPPDGELFARHLSGERAACMPCGGWRSRPSAMRACRGEDGTAAADSRDRSNSGSFRLPVPVR